MNYAMMASLCLTILGIMALLMLPALGLSLFYGETGATMGLGITMALMLALALIRFFIKPKKRSLYGQDGFVLVALVWVLLSIVGALPYYISGAIPNFLDCVFETVSGLTTTSASILSDIEAMPKSLLYWRSFTNWVGGMGVLVFILAVVPMGKSAGYSMSILRAESPGPQVNKLVPKMRTTALILYGIYVGMTALQFVLLLLDGMPALDAITIAFSTAGTGGFGIKNASLIDYSLYTQSVVMVFMVLFGVNFNVYYLLLMKGFSRQVFNQEIRVYIGILVLSSILIAVNVSALCQNAWEALHKAAFQSVSLMTTTGFVTANFDTWPQFSKSIMLMLMVVGACAGSTSGGIKVSRLMIMLKHAKNTLMRFSRPNTVRNVHMGTVVIDNAVVQHTLVYFICYALLGAGTMLLISLDGLSMESSFSATIASLNNIGPGFGAVGPMLSYAHFSPLSKIILCIAMLFGRLEIFPMLLLFAPSTWGVKRLYIAIKHYFKRGGRQDGQE